MDAQTLIHELRCKLIARGINAEPGMCDTAGCHGNDTRVHFPGSAGSAWGALPWA